MRKILLRLALFILLSTIFSCAKPSQNVRLNYQGHTPQSQLSTADNLTIPVPKKSLLTADESENLSRRKNTVIAKIPQTLTTNKPATNVSNKLGPLLNTGVAVQLVNAYRTREGLQPIKLNSQLTTAARNHAKSMSQQDRLFHIGPDGQNPWDRAKDAGYNVQFVAENIGTGQISFRELLERWQNHPKHNRNLLLQNATDMGIALIHNPDSRHKTFWTLMLASTQTP